MNLEDLAKNSLPLLARLGLAPLGSRVYFSPPFPMWCVSNGDNLIESTTVQEVAHPLDTSYHIIAADTVFVADAISRDDEILSIGGSPHAGRVASLRHYRWKKGELRHISIPWAGKYAVWRPEATGKNGKIRWNGRVSFLNHLAAYRGSLTESQFCTELRSLRLDYPGGMTT